jgi:hydrogenase expression/formation protein HypC
MRLIETDGTTGIVEAGGVQRRIGLDLMEDAAVGDYFIIHAGYAIEKLSPEEAQKTLDLFRRIETEPEE